MPNTVIPDKIENQIKEALSHYRKPLRDAVKRNATEGDTGLLVSRLLSDMFGYDPFQEVTSEFKIKGQFVDFAIRNEGTVCLVIEVKAIGSRLSSQHLFQATSYAVHEGVQWAVLTNAVQWDLYRITFGQPVEWHRVVSIDLVDGKPTVDEVVLFHKWGFAKELAEQEWQKLHALSPANLVKALLSDETIRPIGSFIRKATGMRFSAEELREHLVADVLRPGLVGEVSLAELPAAAPGDKVEVRRVRLKSLLQGGFVTPGETIRAESDGTVVTATFDADGAVVFAEGRHTNLYTLSEAAFNRSFGTECWDLWQRESGQSLAEVRDQYLLS